MWFFKKKQDKKLDEYIELARIYARLDGLSESVIKKQEVRKWIR